MNAPVDFRALSVPETLFDIDWDRRMCARSFGEFVKRAWHVIEPATELKWGWALDAMCAHLEAVTEGEILKLLMNVPPGTMKSKLVSVFWPAWEWGPCQLPHHRYIATSHKQDLAVRDNLLCRRLIQSRWYQTRWPSVTLTTDQNEKKKFENTQTGFRESMAFTSMTGSRGSRVILDDPHSVDSANSTTELLNVRTTFKEALPTRVNDDDSAIVVIMQRLHQLDVSGIILDELKGMGWVHLCLPMRFEKQRRCRTYLFRDPRKVDGELLFPERFSEKKVKELEATLGSYAVAGQLQQRPAAREGAMFKREWFRDKIIEIDDLPPVLKIVRHWDLAATKSKDAARTAGVKIAQTEDNQYIVLHVHTMQQEGPKVKRKVVEYAALDGIGTTVSLPQDPGQAGKVQKADFAGALAGYNFSIEVETGDKEARAQPFAAQCEAGNVYLLRGAWNDPYLDELCMFPAGKFKDMVDASSGAFGCIVRKPKGKTVTKVMERW